MSRIPSFVFILLVWFISISINIVILVIIIFWNLVVLPWSADYSSASSWVTARTQRESKAQIHVEPNHQKLQWVAGSAAHDQTTRAAGIYIHVYIWLLIIRLLLLVILGFGSIVIELDVWMFCQNNLTIIYGIYEANLCRRRLSWSEVIIPSWWPIPQK